jgi:hypothetical protein
VTTIEEDDPPASASYYVRDLGIGYRMVPS